MANSQVQMHQNELVSIDVDNGEIICENEDDEDEEEDEQGDEEDYGEVVDNEEDEN